ncbi:MAG TPA: TylF/MycF/NovP-related O-methyltransferase [Chloroflexota bacterium]
MNRTATPATTEALYLDLLKMCLTRYIFPERLRVLSPRRGLSGAVYRPLAHALRARHLVLARELSVSTEDRARGADFPAEAETMIGLNRLSHLQHCVEDVLRQGVPGDLIETGVWRGGAAILMRAILKVYGDTERRVWAADSFQGQPRPDPRRYPLDDGDGFWKLDLMKVSLAEVRRNFERYELLDDQVRFLVGWFRDTLPSAPIDRLAVLRLDGDMYESTMEALCALYPRLSVGGYLIVDDYVLPNCRAAVHDFRAEYGIDEPIETVEWTGAFWQRLH